MTDAPSKELNCAHFQCVGPGSYLPTQSLHAMWQGCPWCEIERLHRENLELCHGCAGLTALAWEILNSAKSNLGEFMLGQHVAVPRELMGRLSEFMYRTVATKHEGQS